MQAARLERLRRFGEAWELSDLDGCMQAFAENAVFCASTGSGMGTEFRGRAIISREIRRIFSESDVLSFKAGPCWVSGEFGFAEWSFVRTLAGGPVEFRGIDLFRFEGDLIALKDSFRKALGN